MGDDASLFCLCINNVSFIFTVNTWCIYHGNITYINTTACYCTINVQSTPLWKHMKQKYGVYRQTGGNCFEAASYRGMLFLNSWLSDVFLNIFMVTQNTFYICPRKKERQNEEKTAGNICWAAGTIDDHTSGRLSRRRVEVKLTLANYSC